jgi:hypothetical protein
MSDKLKTGQDISPGFPGDLDIVVVDATNQFVTVQTTKPNALTHEVLWKHSYKYVGPSIPVDLVYWHLTYQRHF